MKTKFLIILLLLLCITPVMGDESKVQNSIQPASSEKWYIGGSNDSWTWTDIGLNSTDGRSHLSMCPTQDQIVLNALTKQNDLLEELVKAQWVETCYVPFDNNNIGNRPAWLSECVNAGYPVG